MNKREFIKTFAGAAAGSMLLSHRVLAAELMREKYPELSKHKIDKADLLSVNFNYPRFVGKNGTKGDHGQYHKTTILRLRTDQGAEGWGISSNDAKDSMDKIVGKRVVDLITPDAGVIQELEPIYFDLPLFDLMGIIMQKPVYEILGAHGTKSIPVYSGMIYIDELSSKNRKAGIDKVMDNCAWDFDYGYRQLKVKIGRGKMWYPAREGMETDIKIYQMIHEAYKDKGVQLLVDANNAYTLQDTITFLDGIGDTSLYWVEEPFQEAIQKGKKLRDWMDKNGFDQTRYADGEWIFPDEEDIALDMVDQGIVNTYLNDIHAIGITNWMKIMPRLKKAKADGSPHAWGDRLKTNYTTHVAAGLGGIATVEGVTCLSDEIDYGKYPVKEGKITVSDEPGFGMKLLKQK